MRIENKAWLGKGAMILPGVTIGEGAVVGAAEVYNEKTSLRDGFASATLPGCSHGLFTNPGWNFTCMRTERETLTSTYLGKIDSMKLPRHAELWLTPYLKDRLRKTRQPVKAPGTARCPPFRAAGPEPFRR